MKHLLGAACALDYASPTQWLSWGYKNLIMKSAARCPILQLGLASSGELSGLSVGGPLWSSLSFFF